MQSSMRELAVTLGVTVALVLAWFVVLRVAFPDPPIDGSVCPASLGEPAYGECIRSWHESNHARDEHHLVTMLAVILGTTSVALVLARSTRARVPGFRLGLALTAAAGCFAMLAAVVQFVYDGRGAGFAIGAALFALAAAIDGELHPRVTRVLAAIAGAILLLVAGLAWSMLFPGD